MRDIILLTDERNQFLQDFFAKHRTKLSESSHFNFVTEVKDDTIYLNFTDVFLESKKNRNFYNMFPFHVHTTNKITLDIDNKDEYDEKSGKFIHKLFLPLPVIPKIAVTRNIDRYLNVQSKIELIVGIIGDLDAGIFVHDFMKKHPEFAGRVQFAYIRNLEDFYKIQKKLDFYWMIENNISDNLLALQCCEYGIPVAISYESGVPSYFASKEHFKYKLEDWLNLCISDTRSRIKFNEIINLQGLHSRFHYWGIFLSSRLNVLFA